MLFTLTLNGLCKIPVKKCFWMEVSYSNRFKKLLKFKFPTLRTMWHAHHFAFCPRKQTFFVPGLDVRKQDGNWHSLKKTWNLWICHFFCPILGNSTRIPSENSKSVIEHMVMVHESVGDFSKRFLQKLRRRNHVTPKNYLDFIHTYSKLLEEKNEFILGKAM